MNGWYLDADKYYVAPESTGEYPIRQGDVFGGAEMGGEWWLGFQLIHPTCELVKRSVNQIHVARIDRVDSREDPTEQAAIVAGFTERDRTIRVACANTFFLPPVGPIAREAPLF